MTREFNEDVVVKNLYQFLGSRQKEYLPHHVTVNKYLEKLEPKELEDIQSDIVYQMVRRKSFNGAKVLGKWLVLVDGTELDEGFIQKNGNYLEQVYNRGTDREFTKYHRSVLEAKIYFGNGLVASIATEPIETPREYQEKKLSEEAIKLGNKWSRSPILKLLRNCAYTDNLLLQKTYQENHITKKCIKNTGEKPMYHATGIHEAIIDMDTFNRVQEEIRRRAEHFRHKEGEETPTYPFSGMVRCGSF